MSTREIVDSIELEECPVCHEFVELDEIDDHDFVEDYYEPNTGHGQIDLGTFRMCEKCSESFNPSEYAQERADAYLEDFDR